MLHRRSIISTAKSFKKYRPRGKVKICVEYLPFLGAVLFTCDPHPASPLKRGGANTFKPWHFGILLVLLGFLPPHINEGRADREGLSTYLALAPIQVFKFN